MRNPHIFPRGPEEPERPPPPRLFCFFATFSKTRQKTLPPTIYAQAHAFRVYYIYIYMGQPYHRPHNLVQTRRSGPQ